MIVVSTPPVLPFAIAFAARIRGARLVVLVHDVYPDVLIATGLLRSGSWFVRALEQLEAWLYASAERVVVLGRDALALLVRRSGLDQRRFTVIPNWGDIAAVTPEPRDPNPLLHSLGLDDRFVVQFMGNMGRTHGVDSVVEAAARMAGDPAFAFLFVGWGARRAWLEETVRSRNLQNVTVLDPCTEEELSPYLNACDVAIVPFVSGMTGVSVPSRMYNIMAAGRPMIAVADEQSEIGRVVSEFDIGWRVRPGDTEGLVRAIREARNAADRRRAMGVRARAAAVRHYSAEVVGSAYRQLVRDLRSEAPEGPRGNAPRTSLAKASNSRP